MQAVILAGGLGSRLKPFTNVIPKPLLPIGDNAILELQINHLKKYGFKEVFIATNYKSDYIEKFIGDGSRYGVSIKISKERKKLGTVGPLTLLKKELTKPFILINGDILSTVNFRKFYNFSSKLNSQLCVCTKKIFYPLSFGKILYNKSNYITSIEEKPNLSMDVLAGIYFIKPSIIDIIPNNTYFGIDSLIVEMLKSNMKVGRYPIKEYWIDVGQVKDYEEAQEIERRFR
jgi:NDP-sugar pyrophosphorylase family protein